MVDKNRNLVVISAPSGTGKTTIVRHLMQENKNIKASVSYTTRNIRPNETNGLDYVFVTVKTFESMIIQNMFLEFANVFGHYYGTPTKETLEALNQDYTLILEIDWQGTKQVKSVGLEIISIFILPPNYQALRERLLNRKKDNIQTIERRMSAALEEISHYKEFDFIVINDDFEQTLTKLNEIIVSPNTNLHRQSNFYDNFVSQIMAQQD